MRSVCVAVPPGSKTTRTLKPEVRRFADAFIAWLRSVGVPVTVTSTFRNLATQRALYSNYVAGCSRFPAAAPGKSSHGQGRAFDLFLGVDPKEAPQVYQLAGQAWEAIGGTWGGRFNDPIHFEIR